MAHRRNVKEREREALRTQERIDAGTQGRRDAGTQHHAAPSSLNIPHQGIQ